MVYYSHYCYVVLLIVNIVRRCYSRTEVTTVRALTVQRWP